jgi:trigger factor
MKKRILATACAAILCLCGCAAGSGAGDAAVPTDESTIPVVEETLEDAGIDKFVSIPEYKGIKLTRETVEVTDADLKEAYNVDLNQYRIDVPDMEIADYFWVTMDYEGLIDGESFAGSTATNYDLKIGQGTFPESFESQLMGHKQGDSLTIDVEFPEEYDNRDIAGKTATYNITITRVSVALGEPTPDWTRMYFGQSVEEYKAAKLEEVTAELASEADTKLRTEAWFEVFDQSEVLAYPEDMIEVWTKYSQDSYARYAEKLGMDYEDFLAEYGVTETAISENAMRYVKSYLVATAILENEGIDEDDQVYRTKKNELLSSSGYASEDAAVANGISSENIDMTVRYYLACDIILDNAKIQGAESAVETEEETVESTPEESAAAVSETGEENTQEEYTEEETYTEDEEYTEEENYTEDDNEE